MIRTARLVWRGAALTACMIAALVATWVLAEQEPVSLKGEIEVAEYADDGKAVSVMVYDSDWGSVLISKEGKGKELLGHIGAVAKVTGTLVELDDDSGYSYAIRVSGYAIEEPAERDDDQDWDPER